MTHQDYVDGYWAMNESRILYENGMHWVCSERFGKSQSSGFAVYKNGITHSTRVASIGYGGEKGFQLAKAECDRREVR